MTTSGPRPGTSRRERRKREVRDRIVQAAARLFQRQGFEATTVDQIAEAADVAQKTFFNHFPTKHAAFRELAHERVDRLHQRLQEERERPAATPEKLKHCFLRMAEEIDQSNRLARELVVELMRTTPPMGAGSAELSKLHASFGALLEDGRRAGDVRLDWDLDFLVEMVVGLYMTVMIHWASAPAYPLHRRLSQTAAFLGEILSPPQREARRRRPVERGARPRARRGREKSS